jgi:uncharacterized membrane protein HdeD (DUF308 family)
MKSSSLGWYKVLYIVLAVLYLFAGIALVANPAYFAPTMIYMIGWIAVFYGILITIGYFMHTQFKSVWTLVFGIALVILGIVIMSNLFSASVALGAFAGVCFIMAGVYRVYQSFLTKDLGIKSWWIILLLGIANLILGIILIMNLNAAAVYLTLMIGVNLICSAVSDFALGLAL